MTDEQKITPGAPIPVDGRPAWLTDGTRLAKFVSPDGSGQTNTNRNVVFELVEAGWSHCDGGDGIVCICLPEDDPVYAILAAGQKLFDGTSGFMPWRGGDEAPADYGGRGVLFRNGGICLGGAEDDRWTHLGNGWDIIAYEPTPDTSGLAQTDDHDETPIDWQHPENLELVRIDGTGEALPVVPNRGRWPNSAGNYCLREGTPDLHWRFDESGNAVGIGAYHIRNKRAPIAHGPGSRLVPEDLWQRVFAFVKREADKGETTAVALMREIKPEPVDPLTEALRTAFGEYSQQGADDLRAELAKRGGRIVFEGDGE